MVDEACTDEEDELGALLLGRVAFASPFANVDLDHIGSDAIDRVLQVAESLHQHVDQAGI